MIEVIFARLATQARAMRSVRRCSLDSSWAKTSSTAFCAGTLHHFSGDIVSCPVLVHKGSLGSRVSSAMFELGQSYLGQFLLWPISTLEIYYSGQCVPWPMCALANVCFGRCVLWPILLWPIALANSTLADWSLPNVAISTLANVG